MLGLHSALYPLDGGLVLGLDFGIATLPPSSLEFESLAGVLVPPDLVLPAREEWIWKMLGGLVLRVPEASFPMLPSPIAVSAT